MKCKHKRLLFFLALLVAMALTPSVFPQSVQGLAAVRVALVNQPLFVTTPPNDFDRVFIVSRLGKVSTLDLASLRVNATAFLDISSRVYSMGERGLLGFAFDPNFATNGKLYTNYLVTGGASGAGQTRISQFSLGTNGNANEKSEKIMLTYDQIGGDHNGGWIGFSPRPNDANNLYITTGDGGCCNDQGTGHLEPTGNAQSLTVLLGKILRLHIDSTLGASSIPADNPFINTGGARGEIWAYGLRNPFRASFDRLTGRMYIGDVGQSNREEIDAQEPTNPGGGENFEWRLREGTIATPTGNPVVGGARPFDGVDPIFDYPRTTGGSVIGGYVYRGKQIPALRGRYVFGDYVTHKIFVLTYDGTTASNFQDITAQLFPTSTGNFTLGSPASLGEDANGELYICDIVNGAVFKIVPVTPNVEIDSITRNSTSGHAVVEGIGVPFTNVTVEATPMMTQGFSFLATVPVGADGTFSYDDSTGLGTRFYRVTYP
jgi:glucose/arabinose dehydrogenase